eukprot:CAMPEP_0113881194 /NCGR_PEP_ID=MMETSP0780_2-20120614/8229_1 /TAXON_ID=652834 /ORGANISM="Palpitomonas bilix" /LENGTH=72 /DNA_ID=CAMNT_0000868001 /DNA_START=58 /DNA_END=276 /DNA_ORIENTATION=+ /assembly_acc=CAM_ASM_000599
MGFFGDVGSEAVKEGLSEFGGAAGNAIDAGWNGYDAYNSYENGDYGAAISSGIEAAKNGVEAVVDACDGDWL